MLSRPLDPSSPTDPIHSGTSECTKPCSKRIRWAREELNLRPLPCQQNPGNRCAKRRSCRSRPTVDAQVKCSHSLKLNALPTRPGVPLTSRDRYSFCSTLRPLHCHLPAQMTATMPPQRLNQRLEGRSSSGPPTSPKQQLRSDSARCTGSQGQRRLSPQWVGGGHRAWRLGRLGLADLSMVAPARSDEEEAMSTAEPLSKDQWPATGVDLETRRRRILAT